MFGQAIKKIVFVVNGHDQVLRRWAVEYLSAALRGYVMGSRVVDISKENDSVCDGADVVVVYRCFDLRSIRLMNRLRQQGVFVIYFLDDYLFQPNCKCTGGVTYTIKPMEAADILMSSSAELLKRMPFDKPKILRRSVLDMSIMEMLKKPYRSTGDFSVGWLAGAGRGMVMDGFIHEFLRELNVVLKPHEKCLFQCFGRRGFNGGEHVEVRANVYFGTSDWVGYYKKLKSLDLGVVINPMDEKDEFWWCKSELKFVEAGAMGVPLVTSRVPPYLELIKDGVNGFLASTPKEFVDKVVLLMRDIILARKMSATVYQQVVNEYNVYQNAKQFLEDVQAAITKVRDRPRL